MGIFAMPRLCRNRSRSSGALISGTERLTTLLQPSRGHVLLDGREVRDNLAAFKQRRGYVPEEPILYSYIYKGKIRAADSVEKLRGLMNLPSLVEISSQLAEERDLEQV